KPIEKGVGPNWLFDIDSLTNSMNYVPVVVVGTNSTNFLGTKEAAGQDVKKDVSFLRYIVLPNWLHKTHLETSTSNAQDACNADAPKSSGISNPTATSTNPLADHIETLAVETPIPTVSSLVPIACLNDSPKPSSYTRLISKRVTSQDDTPSLDNILTLTNRFEGILGVTTNTDDTNRVEADLGNMETTITASPTPTLRIHKDHPKSQIIGPVDTPIQTRNKSKEMEEQRFIATIHQKTNLTLLQFCLFSCFLSQVEPKKISDALQDPRVRPIGTKWVLKNKKDERGIVIINKAMLVAQRHAQEEGIDYDEVFAHVARIEAIRLFLAYASFMGFTIYQMDVKSVFLYGTIDEEVYVMQPPRFYDPEFLARVYKVEKAMYRLHQTPRAWAWYPKESPFDLVAYSDSDYGDVTQDRKSTTRGCQFFSRRLISWQCKKQTIVATSTTEVEYVAAASGCGQVLWIQNQGEGSGTPTEPHHTPISKASQSSQHELPSPSLPPVTTGPLPTVTPSDTPQLSQYTRRARIAQSSVLPPVANEPASPIRDKSKGEACPTDSGLKADQDRANIPK
nr:putative ribonuclease H-like domain-containing protein [Tanacetum cinerariifolium]